MSFLQKFIEAGALPGADVPHTVVMDAITQYTQLLDFKKAVKGSSMVLYVEDFIGVEHDAYKILSRCNVFGGTSSFFVWEADIRGHPVACLLLPNEDGGTSFGMSENLIIFTREQQWLFKEWYLVDISDRHVKFTHNSVEERLGRIRHAATGPMAMMVKCRWLPNNMWETMPDTVRQNTARLKAGEILTYEEAAPCRIVFEWECILYFENEADAVTVAMGIKAETL